MVRVLGEHQANAAVMQQACMALSNLTHNNAANIAGTAAAGGIEAVVRVLGEHRANAAVMEQACSALQNIAANNGDNKARIAAAGGIEAFVYMHVLRTCVYTYEYMFIYTQKYLQTL